MKPITPPEKHPANPGVTASGSLTLRGPDGETEETFDLAESLVSALNEAASSNGGPRATSHGEWLTLDDSGLSILAMLAEINPNEDGSLHAMTTIQVNHPRLGPDGIFEFQHAYGDSLADAIAQAIEGWMLGDLPVILDALSEEPTTCMVMLAEFPAKANRPARKRRVLFGPVSYYAENPVPVKEGEHGFCPCCLFTNTAEPFEDLLESDGVFALRLYAARDGEGDPAADCRVNGEDYPAGADGLRDYVNTWPPAGFEFRKQYVIVQSV